MAVSKNPVVRGVYFASGSLLLVIGVAGLFLPLIDGTLFLIFSLFCFKNSSEKLHKWMLTNRLFGAVLRDWEEHHQMRKSTKILAISVMWLMILGTVYRTHIWWVNALLLACAIGVTIFILRVKTAPSGNVSRTDSTDSSGG